MRPSAEIDRGDRERLVHRHHEIAGAIDAALLPSAFRTGFAERDAEILDGVVLIDVEIAVRLDAQIEAAVTREELEHVVEEADAGRHVVAAPTLEHQRERDPGFGRPSID